jgi:hypothetical protein
MSKKAKKGFPARMTRMERLEARVWQLSEAVDALGDSKHNPARERLEKRILKVENQLFHFMCGADWEKARKP